MPDGKINNELVALAIAKMSELQAGIEQRSRELERFETYLAVHQELCDALAGVDQVSKADMILGSTKDGGVILKATRRASPRGMNQADFVPFVRALILEHGRPMNKEEVCDSFKRKGRYIGGRPDLELKNLCKKLARVEKEIKHISGAGYWPIDVSCPEVSYMPLQAGAHVR